MDWYPAKVQYQGSWLWTGLSFSTAIGFSMSKVTWWKEKLK